MNIQLTQDIAMPAVGFGTYLIDDKQAEVSVTQALKAGYRHIDTAEGYQNEAGVGRAIRATGISRDDMFVTTKLWPGNPAWGHPVKDRAATFAALDQSLENMGLDYVDLYLIHAPFAVPQRLEQWEALIALREQGKVRAIGVSNFAQDHIEEIRASDLPLPDANQLELHPWCQKPGLTSYLAKEGISVIAYSSLVPLAEWRTAEGHDSAKSDDMRQDGAKTKSPIKGLASKYGVAEAQILLRWGLQKGYGILPKSTNPDRIRQNIDLFSFELDAGDMKLLADMNRGGGVAWASGDPIQQG
jgi:2,5-diketo-D-gluconate reductase A